jgi:hypothetical protein
LRIISFEIGAVRMRRLPVADHADVLRESEPPWVWMAQSAASVARSVAVLRHVRRSDLGGIDARIEGGAALW